jgi:Tfp pilus assembly protein PilN
MKTVVNLLPERLQQRQIVRRHAARWAVAWVVCLLVGPGTYFVQRSEALSLRTEAEVAEAEHAEIQAALRNGDAIQAKIKALQEQQRQFDSLPNGHVPLSLLQLLGRSARTTAGQLRLETIGIREVAETDEAMTRVTVDIEGSALSDQSIGRFVAALRKSGVFESVVLKSSHGAESAKQPSRRFRLQCVFFTSQKAPAGTA